MSDKSQINDASLSDDFLLSGMVSFSNAEKILGRGNELIEQSSVPCHVDLQAVGHANSLTVALLMGWYRHANLNGKSIFFQNLSHELRNIIEFSGLDSVIVDH